MGKELISEVEKKLKFNKLYLIIIIIVILLAIILMFSILNKSNNPLKGTSWYRVTDVDSEYINFYDNGNYSYYFGVGSPVDDSDLCDTYKYNEENKLIILNCSSIISINNKIKVDYIDSNKLVLIFGDEKRIFERKKR